MDTIYIDAITDAIANNVKEERYGKGAVHVYHDWKEIIMMMIDELKECDENKTGIVEHINAVADMVATRLVDGCIGQTIRQYGPQYI